MRSLDNAWAYLLMKISSNAAAAFMLFGNIFRRIIATMKSYRQAGFTPAPLRSRPRQLKRERHAKAYYLH